jgi:hypothetical protein
MLDNPCVAVPNEDATEPGWLRQKFLPRLEKVAVHVERHLMPGT